MRDGTAKVIDDRRLRSLNGRLTLQPLINSRDSKNIQTHEPAERGTDMLASTLMYM